LAYSTVSSNTTRIFGAGRLLSQVYSDFGSIAAPLTQLLKKEGFSWSPDAEAAFFQLKDALTTALVLQLPDFSKDFVVECGASGSGIGVVLHQGKGAVAFFSKPMAPRHRGLAAYEHELIGLVHAVRPWRPYLWGRTFVVRTDHFSLKYLLDQRLATIPQHHWVSKILGFDLSVEYKPGRANIVADALSRHEEDMAICAISAPTFDIMLEIRLACQADPALKRLYEQIEKGELVASWSVIDGLIMFQKRIYIPPASYLLHTILKVVHAMGHEGVQKTLHRFRKDFHTP
jgi:hypothetical protein